jgi:hypothetical protein
MQYVILGSSGPRHAEHIAAFVDVRLGHHSFVLEH